MLEQHEIEHLLAVGELQRNELLGVGRSATAPGSEPGEEEAASSPPASFEADSEGSVAGP